MKNKNPVKGGIRRRTRATPRVDRTGADTGKIDYSVIGASCTTKGTTGCGGGNRLYIPGYGAGLLDLCPGPRIVNNYSTGKFVPGTSIRWEPSVSFTTSGRGYVGFSDNPETVKDINDRLVTFLTTPNVTNYVNYALIVKNLGNVISFPVWQETPITVPTRLRRKMFDCNGTVSDTVDVLDRSMQTAMFWCFDGVDAEEEFYLGSFHYHDNVVVEGITVSVT
jgi:hypothetical protein